MALPAVDLYNDFATAGQDSVEIGALHLDDYSPESRECVEPNPPAISLEHYNLIRYWRNKRTHAEDIRLESGADGRASGDSFEHADLSWDQISWHDPRIDFYSAFPISTDQLTASSFVKRLCKLNYISWLESASSVKTIASALRFHGLQPHADRIDALDENCENDPDEPSIEIGSLRHLAKFLITEPSFPRPRIAVSPDGLMQIEWRIPDNGIVAVKFLANGQLDFAAISGARNARFERQHVSGTHRKQFALNAIKPFFAQINFAI